MGTELNSALNKSFVKAIESTKFQTSYTKQNILSSSRPATPDRANNTMQSTSLTRYNRK